MNEIDYFELAEKLNILMIAVMSFIGLVISGGLVAGVTTLTHLLLVVLINIMLVILVFVLRIYRMSLK
ncbi:MAG: hypothetical protein DRP11_02490 [Candidatus Aenigmatarchaeota archaeon]|nr:MAG: hypothetical protein DRP11_02490 [Candidatus Aenigmarchaeota archaeon]